VPTVLSLTSDDYTVNPAFNGNGTNNMLAAGNLLNVNDKGAILLTVRIPACATTMFTNTATLTGTNPTGGTVTDVSQNGADPDPDADGNPGNNGVGTPVNTTSTSLLGLAKRTVQTINNSDGSADVTFEFNIENFGTTNLTNIQVVENLALAFAPCGVPTVLSLTSDDYTVNPAFNGNGTNNMLAAGNLLNVSDKGAILLTVRIPACATTMFTNTATLTGTNPTGGTVTDVSQNGADPDPDADGNPGNNGVGTPVNTTSVSLLGLAKRTVQTINNNDGSADVTFEFNIENFGTTNLTNIQVVENLAAAFAPCGVPTVLSLTSDDYTVNPAFNGNGTNNMLAAGNTLTVGNKGAILLTVRIPACATTMFTNTATLTGTNPTGGTVTDVSQNGADPDPDADGNPNNNGVGTPVNTTSTSLLGLAKRTVQTINNSDGSADVTFEFNIENFGTTNLTNIQVVENLAAAFAPCGVPMVWSLTSDDYTVNPAFDGSGNINLLAAGNILNVNDKGAILLTVRIPACATTMFTNTATLTGTNPTGGTVTDVSQNGADPDPDADGNPNNNGVGTPVNTTSTSLLGLAKRTVQTINNSDGSADVTFEFNIENFGTTNLTNIQVVENLAAAFAPCGVPTVWSLTSDDYTP
jgi:hypothetical protein